MFKIKFRGTSINNHYVFGLLTKKKIRNSGRISWAIATGNCSLGETVPVSEESVAQLIGYDSFGNEIYDDDKIIGMDGIEHFANEYLPCTNADKQYNVRVISKDKSNDAKKTDLTGDLRVD